MTSKTIDKATWWNIQTFFDSLRYMSSGEEFALTDKEVESLNADLKVIQDMLKPHATTINGAKSRFNGR
jgi:hypothetical protein